MKEAVVGILKSGKSIFAKTCGRVTFDYQEDPLFADVLGDKDKVDSLLLQKLQIIASFEDLYICLKKDFVKKLSPTVVSKSKILQGRFIAPNPNLQITETEDGLVLISPEEEN